jgi:DNA (cytosine-5)-methyltransferase 1
MNYLSVCSGIEAATVAWHDLGFNPVAFSEIEKFPSEVLAHHYPNVPNLGDMTKYKEWTLDTIRLLVGGTPCQSFSVAGLRKGLDDPRGNLALTYVGILDKFRPKWFVWENVPGVLSSGGGRDFGSFLGAVVKLGYGFSYRVLDAQYFGVPQRRKRVFVVGCSSGWQFAAKVLFEPESLSRNTKQSKKKKEGIATFVESSFGAFRTDEIAGTTKASGGVLGGGSETIYVENKKIQNVIHGTQDPCVSEIAFAMGRNNGQENVLHEKITVRKLIPIECERLQGFPDNYTNIKENCPDGHRYKALGNSMAVPVMRWIGKKIKEIDKL